jgi:cellulose synthase operon protein C
LLWQAERAEKDNDPKKAVTYLGRYLEFNPKDHHQRAQLGRLLASDKVAISQRSRERALVVLEQVLSREPDRADLRRLVVRIGMDLQPPRLKLVKEHLDVLEKLAPEDGEVAHLLGGYYEADNTDERGPEKAVSAYRQAVAKEPFRVDSYLRLVHLYSARLNKPELANQVMDALVQANGGSFQAFLHRGRYLLKKGSLDNAAQDVDRARQLAPDEIEVVLAAADLALARAAADKSLAKVQFAQAKNFLQGALNHHAKDARLYLALANVEVRDNPGSPRAFDCLLQGLKAVEGPGQFDLLWALGNLHLDNKNWNEAEAVIGQMNRLNATPAAVAYLQARIFMGKEDWSEAAKLLERANLILGQNPVANKELLVQANLFLGQCYEQLNEPTRQLAAFERVVQRDPSVVAGRLGRAAAQRSLGRLGESIKEYQDITRLTPTSADRWLELARLRMETLLLQGHGDWKEVDLALNKAEEIEKDSAEVVILRAQALMAQKQASAAEDLLQKACSRQPKHVLFPLALAEIARHQGDWTRAATLLNQAGDLAPLSADVKLAWAHYWVGRGNPEAGPALAKLAADVSSFNEDDQTRLLQGLADAAYVLGNLAEAERLCQTMAGMPRHQKDLRLQLLLFDLALQGGNEENMQRALGTIQSIEGPQGAMARFGSALRLIWLAKKGKKEVLDDARVLLDQVGVQRPSWSAVPLAKAEIESLKGNVDQAIANYRKAAELGDHSARVVRPLAQLLYQCQRYSEAEQEIYRLQKQMALSNDLKQLAAEVSLRNQNPGRAVEMALTSVGTESKDYRDYLWLGQILAASGQRPDEAEKNIRKARELADGNPEPWVALVQFLANAKKNQQALEEIERAKSKLTPDRRPLALGQCYEAIGRLESARQHFQEALASKPDDVVVVRALAGFYMRGGRPRDAEPLLRKILDRKVKGLETDLAWSRRGLAMVLGAGNQFHQYAEALELLGLKIDDAGKVVETRKPPSEDLGEELRARARVLASQNTRGLRVKAIALLEDLDGRQMLFGDDRFLLVQLYETEKAWTKACDQLRIILSQQGRQPLYLARLAQDLLHRNHFAEADKIITQLEILEKEPNYTGGSLGSLELKVLEYRLKGQHQKAIDLLLEQINKKNWRSEDVLALIQYYSRSRSVERGLAFCKDAWKHCPPEMIAGASIMLLRSGQASELQCSQVEGFIKAALEQKPRSVGLLMPLADLQDLRGRFAEAAKLYREVLQIDPTNGLALNNLSWLLALNNDQVNLAKEMVEKAIQLFGPSPELLDTRAVVHLALHNPDAAMVDLEKATSLDKPTGYRFFHLARAHYMKKNLDAALDSFRKAKDLGLERSHLHPVEQLACGQVFDELNKR